MTRWLKPQRAIPDSHALLTIGRSSAIELRVFALGASLVAVPVAIGLVYLLFGDALRVSNVREPLSSPELDYLAGVFGAVFIAIMLLCAPLPTAHRTALLFLWAARTATTLGLMLIYEAQYETLDAYGYHELAVESSVQFGELTWGNSIGLVTWLVQLAYALVPSSYHLAKVLFSFVGLVGIYVTWRAVVILTGQERLRLLYLLGLFPSLLFWSSIVGKDPLLVLLVGLFVLGIAKVQQSRYAPSLLLTFTAIALASLVRPWMGAILALPLLAVLMARFIGAERPSTLALAARSAAIALILAAAAFEIFGGNVAVVVQSIDDVSRLWEEGGAAQSVPAFDSLSDVVSFAPLGAFTALFRPLPGDVGGAFGFAAGVENAVLLAAFGLSIVRFRTHHLLRSSFLILAGVLFAWASLYGFLSYQNLGAASRFKAQILPVMLPLMIILWHRAPHRKSVSSGKALGRF